MAYNAALGTGVGGFVFSLKVYSLEMLFKQMMEVVKSPFNQLRPYASSSPSF